MNKDDILKLSRKENRNGDERQERIQLRSYAVSAAVGALLCLILIIVEKQVFDRSTAVIWIIYSGMMFTKYILDAVRLKDRSDAFASVIWGLFLAVKSIAYILDNVG